MKTRYYLAIDLKSFYASVECADRGLDVMTTKLVVADPERKRGTICLAISPAMKALGIKNRCRVYEIPPGIDYIMAPPRMSRYIQVSSEIYAIYLSFIDKDDIHVYSIDEAFLDITAYLGMYRKTPEQLAQTILDTIFQHTKLRATCGIGTNMYLAKIALDILAKHAPNYMAQLDEQSYQKHLWKHRPLTDFWRIGRGTARHLQSLGLFTQEDIAKAPPQLLLKEFGIQSEYLIDHAWGREPCTISEIKNYQQKSHSLSAGQVLMRDYTYDEGLIVLKEMANQLALDMVEAQVVSNNISLYVGYSFDTFPPDGGSLTLQVTTNSIRIITAGFVELYHHHVRPDGLIRRLNLSANSIVDDNFEQYSFFVDPQIMEKDKHISQSVNALKNKFGKNAVLKGMDLQDAATTIERNKQIGGHKA